MWIAFLTLIRLIPCVMNYYINLSQVGCEWFSATDFKGFAVECGLLSS